MKKENLKNYETKKLKEMAKELFSCIVISDCFNVNDLNLYDWVLEELYNRNIEVIENKKLSFSKIGD